MLQNSVQGHPQIWHHLRNLREAERLASRLTFGRLKWAWPHPPGTVKPLIWMHEWSPSACKGKRPPHFSLACGQSKTATLLWGSQKSLASAKALPSNHGANADHHTTSLSDNISTALLQHDHVSPSNQSTTDGNNSLVNYSRAESYTKPRNHHLYTTPVGEEI